MVTVSIMPDNLAGGAAGRALLFHIPLHSLTATSNNRGLI